MPVNVSLKIAYPQEINPLVRPLYEAAFPKQERRDWEEELTLLKAGKLILIIIEYGTAFAGFLFCWPLHGFHFIEHFAVLPELRGNHIGRHVIAQLQEQLGALVLEANPPNDGTSMRRLRFYENAGFHLFPQEYRQPPYREGDAPLHMRLLHRGLSEGTTFESVSAGIYREVYKVIGH
ncbi:Ribosomal protein S18 acetylase RimI [Chitinophaga costaii]|uniref:Ribosomal protein S18 acetylase RimI n=1 Tax=Chitinophaga costaii TaxID=1335309 RepID=A0A1C4BNF5_9BACT|nr:GNAT family N-acetyltransferase [Chitinophaga costaii]PUZ27536.1 N-acetyltransferase [Chitinophaga costaii]SCC08407.1 Ribosomal protein S18 acetylase RimI [Chitinophaga costaii]